MFTMSRRLIPHFLGLLISFIVLLVPTAVCAQESTPTTPDLIVTVRDVRGAPLAGLTMQIRTGVDTPILAQAVSNAQGQVVFTTISVSQVRVRVLGTLASGAKLYQIGADAPGVAVFLGPPPTTLDLRVDADGMVLPDPVTMIDPVPYGLVIATPAPSPDPDGRIVFPTSATYTAPVAPTVAAAATMSSMTSTSPASPAPVAPPPEASADSSASASAHRLDLIVGITGAVVLVGGGLLILTSRGRRHP
jgi:uncharacterized membrane protein YdcZ (DUF606 family)